MLNDIGFRVDVVCSLHGVSDLQNSNSVLTNLFLFSLAADAEERCKECLEKAIETDKDSAEAYQIMASYWLSKDDKEVSASPSIELKSVR